jgi:O-antigen ligase
MGGILFGLWLAIVPVKFGNPVIFAAMLGTPQDFSEMLFAAWPVAWGGIALCVVALAAGLISKWSARPPIWIGGALLGWFAWTILSSFRGEAAALPLIHLTLFQFTGCIVCFAAGLFGLSELRDWRPVWIGVALGLAVIVGTALDQHFGGLEATRQWFLEQPAALRTGLDTPEFRQKMLSDRVFGTFLYPNALAGGLLLLLPVALTGIWQWRPSSLLRWGLGGVLAVGSLAALYWSRSKSGWLIGLVMAALALWRVPGKLKFTLLIGLMGLGIAVFVGSHRSYFEKGASSLSARLDYWRAAAEMIGRRPLLGYGPGTFQLQYAAIKPPEAEMAKLAHNDYLQQGCDSGLPALLAYSAFILGSIGLLYRGSRRSSLRFSLWLGAFAFATQGLTEFGLYIPGLAWPFFLFLGWLWGSSDAQDTAGRASLGPIQIDKVSPAS